MATLGGFLSVLTAPGVSQAAFLCVGEVLTLLLVGPSFHLSQQDCSWDGPWQTVSTAPALLGSAVCKTFGSFPLALGPDQDAPNHPRDSELCLLQDKSRLRSEQVPGY